MSSQFAASVTASGESSFAERGDSSPIQNPVVGTDEIDTCLPCKEESHSTKKTHPTDAQDVTESYDEDQVTSTDVRNSGQRYKEAGLSGETTSWVKQQSWRTTQHEKKAVTVSNAQTDISGSSLDIVIESTRCLIHHSDSRLHVSTYAEKEALKILKQYGSVLITGKSGSGKSRIGFRLLSEIECSTHRIPLVLTSYRQWHQIPQDRNKNKYVVFIDDIFGSSSLVESQLENWGKLFDMMQPAVESGHIMLVLSSRNEIYRKCPTKLKHHPIIQNSEHVSLNEDKYALKHTEKSKFVQKYCSGIKNLQMDDIDRLATFDPPLGFPQCCVFFAHNKSIQKRGVEFFQKPFEFIAHDICMLKETDPVGYLVLLLVIMMENRFNTKLLNKPPAQFIAMIDLLASTCISLFRPPSCAQIREKRNVLSDVYVFEYNRVISFQHQSIFDAVFVNAARDNPEMFLKNSPASILLDYVFIESKEHKPGIHVGEDMFPALAERITELLLSNDANIILDHLSLRNPQFIKTISTIWTKDMLFKLSKINLKPEHLRVWLYSDNRASPLSESVMQELETDIFSYKELISFLIMKGLGSLAKLLISGLTKQYVFDEALTCAVFMQEFDVVVSLLDKGASINDDILTVACCTKPQTRNVTDLAFSVLKTHKIVLQKPERKLSLAIQHGNVFAVEHLVEIILMLKESNDIFSRGLLQLMYQCGKLHVFVPYVPSTSIPIIDILQLLLTTKCSYEIEEMVSAAARHEESSSLKYLLDLIEEKSMPCDLSESLYCALMTGTVESVKLLLQKGAYDQRSFVAAAQSSESCCDKLRLLLSSQLEEALCDVSVDVSHMANFEEYGYVPLHFAVVHCNPEAVSLLVNSGADMGIESDIGMTSFQLAAFTSNTEILHLFLKELFQGGSVSYKAPVTHFVVETVKHMAETANRNGLLMGFLKFVSKTEIQQKKTIDLLVHFGIDINELDKDGTSAIFVAAAVGSTQMVKYLHTKGARLDVVSNSGRTVLHEAAMRGDLEMVKFLCEQGSKVNIKDHSGQSVLHEAIGSDLEAFEKMKYLQEVHFTEVADAWKSVLHAIPFDNVEVAQYLIEQMVNVAGLCDVMKDAFFQACHHHSHNILEYILKIYNGEIAPNILKSPQEAFEISTGLHLAVKSVTTKGPAIVKLLMENGADVNVTDGEGNTALLICLNTVKIRSDNSRSLNIKNMLYGMHFRKTGHGAQWKRAEARRNEFDDLMYLMHLQIIKFLTDKTVDFNIVNCRRESPLHLACQIKHPVSVSIVRLLTAKDIDVNAQDQSGNTALHYAVRNDCSGNQEMIEALMDAGTNANVKNNTGITGVDIIIKNSLAHKGVMVDEMRKIRIILERCPSTEGKHRDMHMLETLAVSDAPSYFH